MIKKENLYIQVENYLKRLIYENLSNPNYRLPTEAELIKQFQISRVTVNTAYKKLEDQNFIRRIQGKGSFINYEESQRILNEMANLAEPNPQRTNRIALIMPSVNSVHITEILNGILQNCQEQDLIVACSENSQEREDALLNHFVEKGCDGILLYPTDSEKYSSILLWLTLNKFPLVLIDRALPGLSLNFVSTANTEAFCQATRMLIEKGHTHIALISIAPGHISSIQERIYGYESTLLKANIASSYKLSLESYPDCETVEEKLDRFFREMPQVTALIAVDHFSSFTTETFLFTSGMKDRYETVYTDLGSVLPFPYMFKDLTYIEQNATKIGKTASELLQENIQDPSMDKKEIRIPVFFHKAN